jgi:uncharacterized delta-60 repeat protein
MTARTARTPIPTISWTASNRSSDAGDALHIEPLEPRRLLASGDLDPTFGVGGRLEEEIPRFAGVSDAVQLTGGKILVSGGTDAPRPEDRAQYMFRRYNADGSLDSTFGDHGVVLGNFTDEPGDDSFIAQIILEPSGKIVARGTGAGHLIARFNADGSIDTSFSNDGIVETPLSDSFAALAVQEDGKVLLSGGGGIHRYDADGSVDTSFGNQGVAATAVFNFRALVVQPDGKILVGGDIDGGTLTRLNSDGSVDTNFGNNGVVQGARIGPDSTTALEQIVGLPNGEILVAGAATDSAAFGGFYARRYTANGTLDSTFGDAGTAFIPFGNNSLLRRIVIDNAGNITFIGWNPNIQISRLTPDGQFDQTFGRVVNQYPGDGVFASAGIIQGNGNLLLIGLRNTQDASEDYHSFATFDRVLTDDSSPASPISFDAGTHAVSLAGTSGDDVIRVVEEAPSVFVSLNGFGRAFEESDVQRIDVNAGADNDFIAANATSINQHLVGGPGRDKIAGGTGRDTIEGNGGRDFLDGGDGVDVISGGAGNDQIRGQASSDHLYGRDGNDDIEGNGGNDYADGGPGIDLLHGNGQNDVLISLDANVVDQVFGDGGTDSATADGDDLLTGVESLV